MNKLLNLIRCIFHKKKLTYSQTILQEKPRAYYRLDEYLQLNETEGSIAQGAQAYQEWHAQVMADPEGRAEYERLHKEREG